MHRCLNPNTYAGVPYNLLGGGYQEPRTGDAYVYFLFLKLTPNPNVNWRTYIQQKLRDTLTAGKVYCVTYWANLVNYVNYAVDELAAYFDDGSLQSISYSKEAIANPQVKSPSGVFYADTLNWMKVQGTFTANGTESYVTFGNFRYTAATTYTSLDGQSSGLAAYFVDDVSVIEADLPAYAGPDKYVIPGDSAYIGRPSEIGLDDDCYWYHTRDKKLESKHKYTIGFLKKFVWPADGGEMADVYFFVNNSTYRPSFTLTQGDKQKYKIEHKFFIKFYPDDPDICEILFDKIVPDTMTHFKIAGWDSLPVIN